MNLNQCFPQVCSLAAVMAGGTACSAMFCDNVVWNGAV